MGLGIGQNSGNKNMWQLYARDPQIRQSAEQRFGVSGHPLGGEGTTGAAGFQANAGGFDWQTLNKFDYSLTGNAGATKPSNEIPSTPVKGSSEIAAAGGAEGNFFTEGLGGGTTTPIVPAQNVAKGEDAGLQKKLASLGTGELTPVVTGNDLAQKIQYFA